MNKKSRRRWLFKAKVLAISGAAVFMVCSINTLYADIQCGTRMKEQTHTAQIVQENVTSIPDTSVMAKPKETLKIEQISGDALKDSQEINRGTGYNPEEEYMLAKIAMAEAESEGVEGKALVILVVLNRVESGRFPNSISEVIFQKGQFSPVGNGRYERVEPDQECYEALDLIQMENWDESQGALYFESKSTSDWHKNNLHYLFKYGNHYFYTDKELAE